MSVKYHDELEQGSDEWFDLRRGILTASEMKLIITPTLKIADNDKTKQHVYELLAQRITGYTEPSYISDDMMRGNEDEIRAHEIYNEQVAPVKKCGFVTNDDYGFTIGFSPDGLVGEYGFTESKSRRQKYQIETIIDNKVPDEHIIQVQTGFIVTKRQWCDYISFCGGLPMAPIRVLPDFAIMEAIIRAATSFEKRLQEKMTAYRARVEENKRLIPTKRIIEQEIVV